MARYEWLGLPGSLAEYDKAAPAPAPAPAPGRAKTDPAVAFVSVSPEGDFVFELPAYELASSNRVNAVHVVLVPAGGTLPETPEAAVSSPLLAHYTADCSALQSGGQVTVDATAAAPGKYSALAIAEFES